MSEGFVRVSWYQKVLEYGVDIWLWLSLSCFSLCLSTHFSESLINHMVNMQCSLDTKFPGTKFSLCEELYFWSPKKNGKFFHIRTSRARNLYSFWSSFIGIFLQKFSNWICLKKLCHHYSFLDYQALPQLITVEQLSTVCDLSHVCFHFQSLVLHFFITEVDHRDVAATLNFRYSFKDFVTVDDDVAWLNEYYSAV